VAVVERIVVRAQRLWEELAGGRFPDPGLARVIENPASLCPPGWAGIVRIEASVLATAPTTSEAKLLQQTLDPAALPILDQLGPAELAYLPGPPASLTDAVEWAGQADLSELVAAVPSDDADESGIPELQRAAVIRHHGQVVAAAGWAPWPAQTAHLCVLSLPAVRGRGLATQVAAAASADALAAGMLPQWRARVGASQRIAAKRRYRVLGEQLSIRLSP
jgi:hypothetical protein